MVKRKFDKISKSLKCFRAKTNRCGGDSWQSCNLLFKNGITHTAGALQLSVGHDAGIQAIVHAGYFFRRNYQTHFPNKCRKHFQFDQSKGSAS